MSRSSVDADGVYSTPEERAGVDPIDRLLAERATLVKQCAKLAALFGPFGMWEARRKELLALCELKVRDAAVTAERRMTEGIAEAESHAHPEYTTFLSRSVEEKANWLVLEDRIQGINDRIRRGDEVMRFVRQEMGLAR